MFTVIAIEMFSFIIIVTNSVVGCLHVDGKAPAFVSDDPSQFRCYALVTEIEYIAVYSNNIYYREIVALHNTCKYNCIYKLRYKLLTLENAVHF